MKHSSFKEIIVSVLIIAVSLLILAFVLLYIIGIPSPCPAFSSETHEHETEVMVMPSIVGYSYQEVKAYYRELFDVVAEGEAYSDEFSEGAILTQSIEAGKEYVKGSTVVRVTVSKGEEPAETTVSETEKIPAETTSETAAIPADIKIENPPAEFESAYPDFELDITVYGLDIPDGRGKEIINELYELMRRHGADAGMVYYDPSSGGSIEYNADEKFSSGSIIKAVYARSILGADIDLSEKYEMTEEMLNSPYELIGGKPVGTEFTAEELVRAALVKSDNTAYKMLYNYIGYDDFNAYAASLGLPQRMTDENYWFRMSARQTAAYFKDIYYFIEQHPNGGLMKECLANAEYREMFSAALPDKEAAEKYGYLPQEDYYTLGDAAVIYGDKPYVLVVYVRGTGENLNTKFFRDAVLLIDELHEQLKVES